MFNRGHMSVKLLSFCLLLSVPSLFLSLCLSLVLGLNPGPLYHWTLSLAVFILSCPCWPPTWNPPVSAFWVVVGITGGSHLGWLTAQILCFFILQFSLYNSSVRKICLFCRLDCFRFKEILFTLLSFHLFLSRTVFSRIN